MDEKQFRPYFQIIEEKLRNSLEDIKQTTGLDWPKNHDGLLVYPFIYTLRAAAWPKPKADAR